MVGEDDGPSVPVWPLLFLGQEPSPVPGLVPRPWMSLTTSHLPAAAGVRVPGHACVSREGDGQSGCRAAVWTGQVHDQRQILNPNPSFAGGLCQWTFYSGERAQVSKLEAEFSDV